MDTELEAWINMKNDIGLSCLHYATSRSNLVTLMRTFYACWTRMEPISTACRIWGFQSSTRPSSIIRFTLWLISNTKKSSTSKSKILSKWLLISTPPIKSKSTQLLIQDKWSHSASCLLLTWTSRLWTIKATRHCTWQPRMATQRWSTKSCSKDSTRNRRTNAKNRPIKSPKTVTTTTFWACL